LQGVGRLLLGGVLDFGRLCEVALWGVAEHLRHIQGVLLSHLSYQLVNLHTADNTHTHTTRPTPAHTSVRMANMRSAT